MNGNGYDPSKAKAAVEAIRLSSLTGQPVIVESPDELAALKHAIRKLGGQVQVTISRGLGQPGRRLMIQEPFRPDLLAYQEAEHETRRLARDAAMAGIGDEELDASLGQDSWLDTLKSTVGAHAEAAGAVSEILKETPIGQQLARYKIQTPEELRSLARQGKITREQYKKAQRAIASSRKAAPTTTRPRPAPPSPAPARGFWATLFGK